MPIRCERAERSEIYLTPFFCCDKHCGEKCGAIGVVAKPAVMRPTFSSLFSNHGVSGGFETIAAGGEDALPVQQPWRFG